MQKFKLHKILYIQVSGDRYKRLTLSVQNSTSYIHILSALPKCQAIKKKNTEKGGKDKI